MDGFEKYGDLLDRLGKHSTGKSCLYVNQMSDVDPEVLQELVSRSYSHTTGGEAAGGSAE